MRGAAVDSRRVLPGEIFVALPGERTDGHRFLADAVSAGATGLIVTRAPTAEELDRLGDVTVVAVNDGLAALQALAAAWRQRFAPLVVGVTGSVAKTSTKEAIATTLASYRDVLKSEGNENNEIGLPLTLLRLERHHQVAVLEMGMYVGGEIALLARLARPAIGVVTAVRPIHLARAGTLGAIEAAKAELVEALPADGVAVLNADDERVRRFAARTRARSVTYGFASDADVSAERVESRGFEGMGFVLVAAGERRPVGIAGLGRHLVHNALAAAAVALEIGLSIDETVEGLRRGWSLPHRGAVVRAGRVTIIDDCYNAGPDSMEAALALLAELPGRHVAVLGEMAELGPLAPEAHAEVGRVAAGVAELLVAVGPGAESLADGALGAGLPAGRLERAPDPEVAVVVLERRLRAGDVVLVKASRSAALERVVDGLTRVLPG